MALFSRSLKPEGDAGMLAAGADSDAAGGPRHTIGDLLRDTRKSYGGDIDRIAATLRIRTSYLTAIEESQYDKLPGPVYAQGFVRAYAVHLGLDGDEAIRRFKQEVAGLEISRDLSFPVPLAARSIPGGTMVLAALILALCGYGLWYYVSTNDRSHPERVSAVPPDLIPASKPPAPDATPPAATPAPAAANSPTASTPVVTPSASTVVTNTSPTMSLPPGVSIAPSVSAPTPVGVPAPPATASSPMTPATAGPSAVLSPAPLSTAPQTASAPTSTAVPPPGDASAAAATPAETAPRVYGAAPNVPTRIVVHAIKDSWVQVRNGDEVLIQRTLHPGDTVRVPDERGLSLRTGNGAGIQFEIDGKLFRPLSGTVRTLALDPDRLVANNGSPPRPVVEFNSGGLPPRLQ